MSFIGVDKGGDVVGVGRRSDLVRVFVKFQIVLFSVAKGCLSIFVIFDARNLVETVAIVFGSLESTVFAEAPV